MRGWLLRATALLEVGIGVLFAGLPVRAGAWFGIAVADGGVLTARAWGWAVLALAVGCWVAAGERSRTARAVAWSAVIYHGAAAATVAAGLASGAITAGWVWSVVPVHGLLGAGLVAALARDGAAGDRASPA